MMIDRSEGCCNEVQIVSYGDPIGYTLCGCMHGPRGDCPCDRTPPPAPPEFFEQVVGVPVEDWHAADTPEALAELLRQRDRA